jgi:hypothetical protein
LHFFDHVAELSYFSCKSGGPVSKRLVVVAFKAFGGPLYVDGAKGGPVVFTAACIIDKRFARYASIVYLNPLNELL